MSRRFSFFGASSVDASSNNSLIPSSLPHENEFSWGRRLSMSILESSAEDSYVDETLKNLYQDADVLEKLCLISVKGRSVSENEMITESEYQLGLLNGAVSINTKTIESVIEELPPEYFTHEFDPVESILWEVSSWDVVDLTDLFMQRIESADSSKDFVLSKLSDMIEANYGALMGCMRDANDINTDLTRAVNQIAFGRQKIKIGCELLDQGSIRIARQQLDRDRQQLICDSLSSLKSIKDLHKSILGFITVGDLGSAAEAACSVLNCLQEEVYAQFEALEIIGRNVHSLIGVIKQKTDKALERLCSRKFAAAEYSSIIKSYLILDHICEKLGGDLSDDSGLIPFEFQNGCIEGLNSRIQKYLFNDIDSCLHSAAIEFIYASQHKKRLAAAELLIQGAYSTMQMDEMVDLAELELFELYSRLTPDLVAPCIIRSCEMLTDIVHSHFLITQWHRSPFDPKNNETAFLHRGLTVPNDEEGDVVVFNLSEESGVQLSEAVGNALSEATTDYNQLLSISEKDIQIRLMQARSARLELAAQSIAKSRVALWDHVLEAVVEMLQAINFSASIPIDDYLAMSWGINAVIALGQEFCGSNCRSLSVCFAEKSKDYFLRLHHECFQVLRQMIDSEPWRSIPVNLAELGGILGIIKKNISFNSDCVWGVRSMRGLSLGLMFSVSEDEENFRAKDGSLVLNGKILEMFGDHGNPLHFMTDTKCGDGGIDDSGSLKQEEPSPVSNFLASMWDDVELGTNKSKKPQDLVGSMVVTQTALNGLARYAGRYFQLMHLIPSAATEIFGGLCQLFDYYLCAVFHGFVPHDERQKVLMKQTKSTSPPPDQSKDFEALQAYMERAMNDVIPSLHNKPKDVVVDIDSLRSPSIPVKGGIASSVPESDVIRVSSIVRLPVAIEYSSSNPLCFYSLNERIVAAESCWFSAKILSEIKFKVMRLLPDRMMVSCESYFSQYQFIAGQLRGLIYRAMCPQLIKSNYILCQILDSSAGWDSKRIRSEQHDWIDKLSINCREVWEYLLSNEEFADSSEIVREQVWLEICQAAFDVLLEGFSRVRKCSPEGRAVMTMDTAVLHNNLVAIHSCRPPRGCHHIDSFIQASYLSEEDLLIWVKENWQVYAYRHMAGLLTQTLSSVLNSKKLKDAISLIDALYDVENQRDDSSMLSNLLSTRIPGVSMGGMKVDEVSSISSLFGQRIRRS